MAKKCDTINQVALKTKVLVGDLMNNHGQMSLISCAQYTLKVLHLHTRLLKYSNHEKNIIVFRNMR